MSNFKTKYIENKTSATLLYANKKYSSCIHSAYYSNIQLMLHILISDFGKTQQEITTESKQGSIQNKGFHNWLKNEITRALFLRNNHVVRDFNNFFGQLKNLRVTADYKNKLISNSKAKMGIYLSANISEILINEFTI